MQVAGANSVRDGSSCSIAGHRTAASGSCVGVSTPAMLRIGDRENQVTAALRLASLPFLF